MYIQPISNDSLIISIHCNISAHLMCLYLMLVFVCYLYLVVEGYESSRVVDAWVHEKDYYMFASTACTAGKVCGHYTQVIICLF